MLAVILLSLFMVFIPYWIRRFDVYTPFTVDFSVFTYAGVLIFFAALPFCLYSIVFLIKRTGGMPVDRVRGGTPPVLVIDGPYRFVRNPQQLSSIIMLLGLSVYFESISVLVYTVVVTVFSHIHVVFVEEKGLKKRFGTNYENYCKDVPRWIPRR